VSKDPIVEAVKLKMDLRSQAGLVKYGVGTDRDDLSLDDWLNHAQEEAMDFAIYLERIRLEMSKMKLLYK